MTCGGYETRKLNGVWVYKDNNEPVDFDDRRPCPKCNLPSVNGHDACILNLKGVRFACCGHGIEGGYFSLISGVKLPDHPVYKVNTNGALYTKTTEEFLKVVELLGLKEKNNGQDIN